MLWWRRFAKAQAVGKAKGRQEADEIDWFGEHSARGFHRSAENIRAGYMGLNWFYSRTVRRAGHMHKHVRKLLSAQLDILPPEKIQRIRGSLDELQASVRRNDKKKEI